nr:immunoglobulin heavy chain junction region [Mus musculus]
LLCQRFFYLWLPLCYGL